MLGMDAFSLGSFLVWRVCFVDILLTVHLL